jgi:hypothetical protein
LILLLLSIPAGLVAGLVRARLKMEQYQFPDLRRSWLVLVAFLPQFLAFQLPATRSRFSDELAAAALVGSQLILIFFALSNLEQAGFPLLGLGLALNLVVIITNGGLMPISPETVTRLFPASVATTWISGQRLGTGKDVILAVEDTHLPWLADQYLLPTWFPYRAAYSIGDVVIAAGVFLFLCYSGRQRLE